ncbi:hypothetical protein [Umezawaea sp. Da 62-37]|uniref:hypothetical protein n=1 Tax=Umezawaea sp. Da 62-37 TaxID=3075927 RepID=UPI0028F6E4C2|nr:hypothetical protein [Umezawaea sp. Da 62-37]WNV83124.1 hypothetical protein RM788_33725 [Umezawaea sp. Da 62-37]
MSADAAPIIPAREVLLTGDNPATVTATVLTIEHREEIGVLGRMVGLDAHLHLLMPGATKPHSYFLSRLVGEPHWVQDAHFGPNGYPTFSHGFGARYLKLTGIHTALEAILDEAATARNLATEIGPDIPLALPRTADTELTTPDPDDSAE